MKGSLKKFVFLLCALVSALPGLANAEVLSNDDALLEVAVGSRIEVTRPMVLAFGSSATTVYASMWSSTCTLSHAEGYLYSKLGFDLRPGDYLTVEDTSVVESDASFVVVVHAKNGPKDPGENLLRISCHHAWGSMNVGDPREAKVEDLRRALGWNVWVNGSLKSDASNVAGDASGAKSGTLAPDNQAQTRNPGLNQAN